MCKRSHRAVDRSRGDSEGDGGDLLTLPEETGELVMGLEEIRKTICNRFLNKEYSGLIYEGKIYCAEIDNAHIGVVLMAIDDDSWRALTEIRDSLMNELGEQYPSLNAHIDVHHPSSAMVFDHMIKNTRYEWKPCAA